MKWMENAGFAMSVPCCLELLKINPFEVWDDVYWYFGFNLSCSSSSSIHGAPFIAKWDIYVVWLIDHSLKGNSIFQTRNPPRPLETGQLLQPLWRIQRSVCISFASTARAASLLMVKKRRWLERGKDLESMKNHESYRVRGFYCQISLLKGYSCQSWWKKSWRGVVRMENGMHFKRRSDCCRCDDVVHIYRQFDIEFVLFQECSDFL